MFISTWWNQSELQSVREVLARGSWRLFSYGWYFSIIRCLLLFLKPYPSVGMDVLHSLRQRYHSPCTWENSFHWRLNVLKSSCYYIDNIQLNHFNSWRSTLSHETLHTETAKIKTLWSISRLKKNSVKFCTTHPYRKLQWTDFWSNSSPSSDLLVPLSIFVIF